MDNDGSSLPKAEHGSVESHSKDENSEKSRTEDDMRSSGSTNLSGQEHEMKKLEADGGARSERIVLFGGRGAATTVVLNLNFNFPSNGGAPGVYFTVGGSQNCSNSGTEGHLSGDRTGCEVLSSPAKRTGVEGQEDPKLQTTRLCPCGAGACLVLTSKSENNPGRCYYKCPLLKSGRECDFFEWYNSNQQPQVMCKCGERCIVLTAKTDGNKGRQFYKCPKLEKCGFFKWCDEVGGDAGRNSSATPTRTTSPGNGRIGNCFKCNQQGHWANNCTSSPGYRRTTCFKCNQEGHWAKDCTD